MDLEDWQLLNNRLDTAHRNFNYAQTGVVDLWRMHRTVNGKLQKANAEWINCRRRGRGSPRFDQLLTEAEEALKNLEGYILLAKLMYKEHR